MRLQNRNKRTVYYADYLGTEPITDSQGNFTGEERILYSEKKPYRVMVTVATTATNAYVNRRDFGNEESYQLSLVCPIRNPFSATTVFWVDDLESETHDYHVIGITNMVNQSFVTIRKIQVS